MRYLNKFFILLSFYLFSSLPILANDIVVTRKAPPNKALLDRKFIFMQEGQAFQKSSTLNVQRSTSSLRNSSVKSLIPTKAASIQSNKKNIIQPPADNWDAYAEEVEIEESLNVGARLIQ